MAWKFTADRPIYLQLMEEITLRVVTGVYEPGDKLPSVRELVAEVNPNTMQRALSELEATGMINAQRTSGRYVTNDSHLLESYRQNLARGYIREALQKLAPLGYTPEEVLEMLRQVREEVGQ